MKATHNQYIGKMGEQIASDYLLTLGYTILHRNFRTGKLEVDIIARQGEALFFVEVKCRTCRDTAVTDFMPESAMTATKRTRIEQAAAKYAAQHLHDGDIFIELIAINFNEFTHSLRHYRHWEW